MAEPHHILIAGAARNGDLTMTGVPMDDAEWFEVFGVDTADQLTLLSQWDVVEEAVANAYAYDLPVVADNIDLTEFPWIPDLIAALPEA